MRLDARNGEPDRLYQVYDAEECRIIRDCVWVDDELHAWGQGLPPLIITRKARCIVIYPTSFLVVINPVDDAVESAADASICETVPA